MQMEKSQSASLDLTVISAEALRISNRWVEKNAFVTVRTDTKNSCSTSVDRNGGSNPAWNQKVNLALPPSTQSITVEVHCKTSSGSRMVGTANVPMSDIVADFVPAYQLHFLSYRLRQPDGGRNGVVNLSVKMVGQGHFGLPMLPLKTNNGGVAVGIPVSYGYGM